MPKRKSSQTPDQDTETPETPGTTTGETKPKRARKKVPAGDRKDTATRAQKRAAEKPVKPDKPATKASRTTESDEVPVNAVATLGFLLDNEDAERSAIRKGTGLSKLGLPWLTENEHVKSTVEEGQRAHKFNITTKGKRFYKKHS